MFPWEDGGNSQWITIRGPSLCIFYFRSCLYDLPFATSLHHIYLPLSQHSPSIITAHMPAHKHDTEPFLSHCVPQGWIPPCDQTNTIKLVCYFSLMHTHTHTASLQGLKQKPLLYYSGRHTQVKHELISLQTQILYLKKRLAVIDGWTFPWLTAVTVETRNRLLLLG